MLRQTRGRMRGQGRCAFQQWGLPPMALERGGKRRFPRYAVDLKVRILATIDGKATVSYGGGHELGQGGMAIYVPLELTLGDEVRVEFEIPRARSRFQFRAVIRNKDGYRYGIEFTGLSAEEAEKLKRALDVIAPESAGEAPLPPRQIVEEQCFEHVVVTLDPAGGVEQSEFSTCDILDAAEQQPQWPEPEKGSS